jgi:MerR family transcriptional regulator, thiopeptide resistance regulator
MAEAIDRQAEARKMGIQLEPHELLEALGEDDPTRYAAEAEQRWGETDAYRQSQERARGSGKQDWLAMRAEQEDLEARLAAAFAAGAPADGDAAAELVEEHRLGVERWFDDCPHAMHRELGRRYVYDERLAAHYDRRAPGLAAWLCAAVEANAARHGAA